ncbi:thioredoxin family protein, partial [Candidatus Pacearchaeota archaeon]|nr:thioredoxin family protein [Candidatus Pacearchaeota archaeon]
TITLDGSTFINENGDMYFTKNELYDRAVVNNLKEAERSIINMLFRVPKDWQNYFLNDKNEDVQSLLSKDGDYIRKKINEIFNDDKKKKELIEVSSHPNIRQPQIEPETTPSTPQVPQIRQPQQQPNQQNQQLNTQTVIQSLQNSQMGPLLSSGLLIPKSDKNANAKYNPLSHRIVIVQLSISSCGYCRLLNSNLAETFSDHNKVYYKYVNDNYNINGHYGARSFPTTIIFKDGRKIGTLKGNVPDNIKRIVNQNLDY